MGGNEQLKAMIDELSDQIIAAAKPELERLQEMASRYDAYHSEHRFYAEKHERLYRRTVDALTRVRKPLVGLAMLEYPKLLITDATSLHPIITAE